MNKKYQDIIVEVIKNNARFQGHEDLLDDVFNDVVERLGSVLDAIDDETIARSYIERIAKLSVITLTKQKKSLTPIKVSSASRLVDDVVKKESQNHYEIFDYTPKAISDNYSISEDLQMSVEQAIMHLNNEYPTKDYVEIYKLRFIENKSVEEISEVLKTSQAQTAERLFDLTALVKRICGNEVSQV